MKLSTVAITSFLVVGVVGAFVARPSTGLARAAFSPRPNTVRHMSADAGTAIVDFVKSEIASNDVVVFSKTYCPFCRATKSLLIDNLKLNPKVIELDEVNNGAAIQDALLGLSGQRTVPNVFIKGEHLGGNDVTQAAAASGKLQQMLGM
jgi:glutaredoxin 3